MTSPFSLVFPPGTEISEIAPADVTKYTLNPVPYAKATSYRKTEFFLLQQSYQNFLIYLELYEGEMTQETIVELICDRPTLFFIYVLEGTLVMNTKQTGENVIQEIAGQYYAHFIPKGHYNIVLPVGRYGVFYFVFRSEWFEGTMKQSRIYFQISKWLTGNHQAHLPLATGEINAEVKTLLLKMQQLAPIHSMKLDIQILLILEKLVSIYDHQLRQNRGGSKSNFTIARIVRIYIHDGILRGHQLGINELADQLSVTPKTLLRSYRMAFGQSPQQYITKQKMAKARELILTTEHPLSKISAMLGYQYYSSFSRKFSKHFGYTPEALRQTNSDI